MKKDSGLDTLLDLNGSIIDQGDGYWIKIEAKWLENPTDERPHGIKYSLSLHDSNNLRILGFDNAHAIKSSKTNCNKPVVYDHKHRNSKDKGVAYEFVDA